MTRWRRTWPNKPPEPTPPKLRKDKTFQFNCARCGRRTKRKVYFLNLNTAQIIEKLRAFEARPLCWDCDPGTDNRWRPATETDAAN